MPIGPIALLIVEAGLSYGFARAFLAGAGAASADLLYASAAAFGGGALVGVLGPATGLIRAIAGFAVSAIGLAGLWRLRRTIVRVRRRQDATDAPPEQDSPNEEGAPPAGPAAIYFRFVGLTMLNPLTIGYFAAIVVGGPSGELTVPARMVFAAGAAAASLSWQSLLALVGSALRRRLTLNIRFVADIIGNLIVVVLGVRILFAVL
ncbi:MAG TPA: LysE family transporter [Spirochaetia bacterium]|nr:LysE family transporter [Spirochaetia bacterium]